MADRLTDLIGAIADGTPVDWDAAEAAASHGRPQRRVRTLRALAGLVSAHRTIQPLRGSARPEPRPFSAPAPDRPVLGTWGPYVLVEHLGSGTSADVFRAYDPKLDRDVALKLLTPFHSGRDEGDAVITEGRHLARVKHPNIAAVHAAERIGGRVGIVMELVEGRSLEQRLQEDGPFTCDEVVQVGVQLCDALAAVHGAGLIHRDVKAQNVIQEAGGRLVLTDFGTAVDRVSGQASPMAGTPVYAAPELFAGGEASARSDLYSLGVLLFRLLTGAFPVGGDTLSALCAAHRGGQRRTLRTMRPDAPASLAVVIERALSPQQSDRDQTTQAMRQALVSARADGEASSGGVSASRSVGGWIAAAALTAATAMAVWTAADGAGRTDPRASEGSSAAPAASAAPDGVLVARFENATGDPELDEVIALAVERELTRSTQLHLVSRERVEDVLRLMKRPADTAMDAALAREVGLRDGAVRAVLAGRIDRLGPRFTIEVRVLDVVSGRTLEEVSEAAPTREQLMEASQRLADRLRVALGEAHARDGEHVPLERVTTPSLWALRLYSDSYRMGRAGQWHGALELARRAVIEDPAFASAQIWLAWALRNTGASQQDYLPVARGAMALAGGTDEVEQHWVTGSYYYMAGEDARAEQAYQALLQLQPDHPWAVSNLTSLYERQRRLDALVPLLIRLADRRPHDLQSNHAAAVTLLAVHGDFERARPYAGRVRTAGAPELAGQHLVAVDAGSGPAEVAWAYYFDAAEELARRDVVGVNVEVARIIEGLTEAPSWLHGDLVANAVQYYLTTGQARRALSVAEGFRDRRLLYPYYRAVLAYSMDDYNSARQFMRDLDAPPIWPNLVWLMGRLGMADHAERWLRSLPDRTPLPGFDNLIAGHLGLARGNADQAIPALERLPKRPGTGRYARITADLADAWLKKGDTDRAIQILQESLSGPTYDVLDDGPVGYLWIPNALLLAELCQDRPCRAQGASIVADVDRLLSQADADYPQRQRLDRLKAGAYRP